MVDGLVTCSRFVPSGFERMVTDLGILLSIVAKFLNLNVHTWQVEFCDALTLNGLEELISNNCCLAMIRSYHGTWLASVSSPFSRQKPFS